MNDLHMDGVLVLRQLHHHVLPITVFVRALSHLPLACICALDKCSATQQGTMHLTMGISVISHFHRLAIAMGGAISGVHPSIPGESHFLTFCCRTMA